MPVTGPFAKGLQERAGVGPRFLIFVVVFGAVLGASAASRAAQAVVDEDDPDPGVVRHPTQEQREHFSRKGLAKRATKRLPERQPGGVNRRRRPGKNRVQPPDRKGPGPAGDFIVRTGLRYLYRDRNHRYHAASQSIHRHTICSVVEPAEDVMLVRIQRRE